MVHLALLLIGANALRSHWRFLVALGLLCIAFGLMLAIDVWNGVDVFTIDVVGIVLFTYGLCDFLAAIAIGPRRSGPALIRSMIFMLGGAVVYDTPFDHDVTAMVIFGTAFLADGLLRIVTAMLCAFRVGGGRSRARAWKLAWLWSSTSAGPSTTRWLRRLHWAWLSP